LIEKWDILFSSKMMVPIGQASLHQYLLLKAERKINIPKRYGAQSEVVNSGVDKPKAAHKTTTKKSHFTQGR
jgi:hypothetical protein